MQLVLVVVAAVTLLPLAVALPQTSPISSTTAPVTSSTQASVWPVPAMAAGNATVGGTGNPSTSDQPLIFTGNGTVAAAPEDEGQELKRSYHRGWGSLPKLCDPGWEYQIGLCYPVCPQGFHGAGPVCWETCPEGYVDLAVSCYLSASTWHFKKSEGRTAGKIPVKCDLDQDSVEDTQSERELVFCYEKCQPGYSGWGARCFLEDVDAAKAGATASESAASMSVV